VHKEYPNDLKELLHRDDLAEHIRRFASTFNIDQDVLLGTTVQSTSFNSETKKWNLKLAPSGKTVFGGQLVLATGICSWAPHVPEIEAEGIYQGINVHSHHFKNGRVLAEKGAKVRIPSRLPPVKWMLTDDSKSVIVIGSANTAFDVAEDCYNAGLETTMIQRSPTHVLPVSYLLHPDGFGAWEHAPVEVVDPAMLATPFAVGGQLSGMLHASLASQEPYDPALIDFQKECMLTW